MPFLAAVLIGTAVAGGVATMARGNAEAAAAEQRNQQAYQNWLFQLRETGTYNAREQFLAAYNFAQQTKRNSAITDSAYRTKTEKTFNLKDVNSFQHRQLANQGTQAAASLMNAMAMKNISVNSGMYANLSIAQNLDLIRNASQLKKNYRSELQNIDREFRGSMAQKTENIFVPNIRQAPDRPGYENPSIYSTAGYISGGLQIGGAVAGGIIGGSMGGGGAAAG